MSSYETSKASMWNRLSRAGATRALVVAAIGSVTLAACSSSSTSSMSTTSSSATATTSSCHAPAEWTSVKVAPVAGTPTDHTLTSFDGTPIRMHWFPLSGASKANPAPTVLMGPGWGSGGDTNSSQVGLLGEATIAQLWKAGFNVLTWDPRGFGSSGGQAEVDSVKYEAKDVSLMIDWVAAQPGVQVDAPGVPRIGMVGGSYGGGIQFVTASIDCRVDAIAPTIAWHSLLTSLAKSDTVKSGWSNILMEAAAGKSLDPQIVAANKQQSDQGTISQASRDFFGSRGPDSLLSKVHVPTLILQGTVDDLFTLQEGAWNYETLHNQGNTVSMVWFCGGHGVCLTNPGNVIDAGAMSVDWMIHYVKKDTSVPVLHGFLYVDQSGTSWYSKTFPPAAGPKVNATGSGTLALNAQSLSGPSTATPSAKVPGIVDTIALGATPAPATTALNVPVTFSSSSLIAGAPELTLKYTGTTPTGSRPTRVFAQLVDTDTGLVLNNQITPIPVTLDGSTHSLTIPLEMITYSASPNSHVELQLVATTVAYATPRLGGSIDFTTVGLSLPTVTGVTKATTSH